MKAILAHVFTIKPRVPNREVYLPKSSLKRMYGSLLSNKEKVYEDNKMDGRIPDVYVPLIGRELRDGTIKDMELEELDRITTTFENGKAIRECEKYKLMIDENLKDYKYLTDDFKKNSTGSLVVLYLDKNYQPVKLKTLYKADANKLDSHEVLDTTVDYFADLGKQYARYFILEYGDMVDKDEEFLDSVRVMMKSDDKTERKEAMIKAINMFRKSVHNMLDDEKTHSNTYFQVRRMDSTMRNAMKKLGHKVSDLKVNEDMFTNEDSYILVDNKNQIMLDIGQKVDGKSIRKVKIKKED